MVGRVGILGLDWVNSFENGSYEHRADPRHATIAITDTTIQRMKVDVNDLKQWQPCHSLYVRMVNNVQICIFLKI